MPQPSATWNTKRVHITYRNVLTSVMEPGTWTAKLETRIVNTLSNGTRQVFRAGRIGEGNLNTNEGSASLIADFPIVDDPDNMPQGGQVTLVVTFSNGDTETFKLSPLSSWPDGEGTDLALILNPSIVPSAPPYAIKGVAGGVAALDSEGYVLNGDGDRIVGGGTGGSGDPVDWDNIIDRPAVIAAGSTQQEARIAIAAPSTSEMNDELNLKVNTSTYTAGLALKADLTALTSGLATKVNSSTYVSGLAGKADLSAGLIPLSQIPDFTSAKISDFVEAAQDAVNSLLVGASGVTLSYNDTNNTLTITGGGSGGLDAEAVRDAIGVALIGAGVISVSVNDVADTITISSSATVNDTDANLKNRANHTGTQLASTISDFANAMQATLGNPETDLVALYNTAKA